MEYWQSILLGVVQGLTEFLPISSSAHLVLGKFFLGIKMDNITFEIFVHFGTLLAVVTLLWREIVILLNGVKCVLLLRFNSENKNEKTGLQLLGLVMLGILPAGILGVIFKDTFEEAFSHPVFVCSALVVTGLLLMATRFSKETQPDVSYGKALLIGFSQVAAIFPGISRSGTTISTAMLLGINRVQAARFSFLLAVPLIFGATLLQVVDLWGHVPAQKELINIGLGTVAAYISGLFAIKWLLAVVEHGRFARFAYYCFAVGIGGLLYFYTS